MFCGDEGNVRRLSSFTTVRMKGGIGEDTTARKNVEFSPVHVCEAINLAKLEKEKEAGRSENVVQKISTKQIVCLCAVILIFLLSVTGTMIMWGTNMFEDALDERLILRRGSEALHTWSHPPVNTILKFRLFNYTNVEEFSEDIDAKLRVEEVGPFTFREKIERVNIVFNDNGTLTYQERKIYTFAPELSGASLDDKLVVINMPYVTMNHQSRNLNYFEWFAATNALKLFNPRPLFTKTAREVLLGYKDSLTSIAELKEKVVRVGIVESMNGTSEDRVTMYSGEMGIDRMGQITRYNGLEHMDYYPGSECNRVDGNDDSKFAPSQIYPGSILRVYNRDACRIVDLVYEKEVKVLDDIPTLRFSPPDNVFGNKEDNPDNACYCGHPSDIDCQLSGVADVSKCKKDTPVFVSHPHFYMADPLLQEVVDGLNPDPDKHKMYIDIHQRLGVVLGVKSRFQINMLMYNGLQNDLLRKLDEKILPILWMEKELDEFPPDIRSVIGMVTHTLPIVKAVMSYGCPVLVFITGTVLLVCIYIEVAALLRKDPPSQATDEDEVTRL